MCLSSTLWAPEGKSGSWAPLNLAYGEKSTWEEKPWPYTSTLGYRAECLGAEAVNKLLNHNTISLKLLFSHWGTRNHPPLQPAPLYPCPRAFTCAWDALPLVASYSICRPQLDCHSTDHTLTNCLAHNPVLSNYPRNEWRQSINTLWHGM